MDQLNRKFGISELGIDPDTFNRPVKVVQFGTGVLLRGLVDFIFQKANDLGYFNGNIAMVKSTSNDISEFEEQDGIYTVVESGLDEKLESKIHSTLIYCVHPVWSATDHRQELMRIFASPLLELVVSNTTEIGLLYHPENILEGVPSTFPGNLTSLLYHRFISLKGTDSSGLKIIPTELLIDNGQHLKNLVQQHARANDLPSTFIEWMDKSCEFCDSLVDRIVPGKLKSGSRGFDLPYQDKLAIQTEPYFLWAIQSDSIPALDFFKQITGLIVTRDIQPYREQKLRLLNGGHTILSPLAFLLGCRTVEEMMNHAHLNDFLSQLCESDIIPTLEHLSPEANVFYRQMKTRWLNPFMNHALKSILAQSTTKMQVRNGDSFIRYFEANQELPTFLTFGFAAYLFLFKPRIFRNKQYFTLDLDGNEFEIVDSKAGLLFQHWLPYYMGTKTMGEIIPALLNDEQIFNHHFVSLPGFKEKITELVQTFEKTGMFQPLLTLLNPVPINV
ncbi:MAG: tagaturonate reductase [Saprospiraceae bacterium]|nr:tagaturonate reductase [Saprospiraceae bacterium]